MEDFNEKPLDYQEPQHQQVRFAGFWIRFAAYVVDYLLIGIPMLLFNNILDKFLPYQYTPQTYMNINDPSFLQLIIVSIFEMLLVYWPYFAITESSAKQATIGKQLMKIKVVNKSGERITFGRATIRYFSKILSAIIFYFGFIMAGIDVRKQALHDKIAQTYVVYNQ